MLIKFPTNIQVYPILLIVLDVRAGVMVFRLNGAKDVIAWECRNNGALYNTTLADATYEDIQAAQAIIGNTLTLPKSFCNLGVHSLYLAFAFSLAVDIGLQICTVHSLNRPHDSLTIWWDARSLFHDVEIHGATEEVLRFLANGQRSVVSHPP